MNSGKANYPLRYRYFDICLLSKQELPVLLPWTRPDPEEYVIFETGSTPEHLMNVVYETPLLQIAADGSALFRLQDFGRFHVSAGSHIVFTPLAEVLPEEIVTFLTATVACMLLYQRGRLLLHASAVDIDGKAALIAAPTGTGKSTLAAALVSRGHRLIADDIAVIASPENGSCVPSGMTLKLGPDTVEALDFGAQAAVIVRRGQVKKRVMPSEYAERPVPVGAVFRLSALRSGEPIRRLSGVECLDSVSDILAKPRIGKALGQGPAMFFGLSAMAARIPFYRLERGPDLAELDGLARTVEDAMRRN